MRVALTQCYSILFILFDYWPI